MASATVSQEAEVPDLHEARGQNMLEEAAQELYSAEGHNLGLAIAVVPPLKAHLAVSEGKQPRVGDGDAVGISREIS